MNERLEELAKQAGLESFYIEWSPWQVEFEKFAQLLLKECMEQVWYTREDEINDNVSEVIKDRIKEHFGVEE